MLRLMLDHHPLVAFHSEFEFVVDLMDDDGTTPDSEQYLAWLSTHRIFQATHFEVDRSLTYNDLVRSFLEQFRSRESKRVVGATVHHHFDRVLHIWPDARFIHLVRDPRDVTSSVMAMGWAGNVWTGVRRWLEAELLWERMATVVSHDRRHEVHYESLLAHPASTLAEICQFIGIEYSPAMLSYPDDTSYDAPNQSSVFQWKRKLRATQVRLVESRVGDMLTRRGYAPSELPAMHVGSLFRTALRLQDWVSRFVFRVRRYGLQLVIEAAISRRLGFASWYRRCVLRMNEITTAHLK